MSVDETDRITRFEEKPEDPQPLSGTGDLSLASMGIYVFSMDLLQDVLLDDLQREDTNHDFGHDIIPRLIEQAGVYAYRFGGEEGRVSPDRYWRDVGTLDSFYEANMDLLNPVPSLDLYQPEWPVCTYTAQYPPARTVPGLSNSEGIFINSMVSGGVVIAGGNVQHSILFPHVTIGDEAIIHDSILFKMVCRSGMAQIWTAASLTRM
jgi:glucose-1-phosphate adenylyltransferase